MHRVLRRNNILNEARIKRTIDPKIWASMSSTSSKYRSTKAADNKPKSSDSKEVILQKYVAGLLTMGTDCPLTEEDITTNVSYKNFGITYLNMGGSIEDIQKLYVENGGTLPENATAVSAQRDYPSYDEVDVDEQPVKPEVQKRDYPSYDEADIDEQPVKSEVQKRDYPSYDEVDIDDTKSAKTKSSNSFTDIDMDDNYDIETFDDDYEDDFLDDIEDDYENNTNKKSGVNSILKRNNDIKAELADLGYDDPLEKLPFGKKQKLPKFIKRRQVHKDSFDDLNIGSGEFASKIDDDKKMQLYFRTLGTQFYGVKPGDSLIYDDEKGLIASNNDTNAIMKCVIRKGECVDKKARFMFDPKKLVRINFIGNDSKYNDYYFKEVKEKINGKTMLMIQPRSALAREEESNGLNYTQVLAELGNNGARLCKIINLPEITNINLPTEQLNAFNKNFKKMLYLPTLPELFKVSDQLTPGNYLTSSITDKGEGNIVLRIGRNNKEIYIADDPTDKVKIVIFAKF